MADLEIVVLDDFEIKDALTELFDIYIYKIIIEKNEVSITVSSEDANDISAFYDDVPKDKK